MKLRKKEIKIVMGKVTKYVANCIKYYNTVGRWTDTEIYDVTGVPNNRLSEIKNFKKYNKIISQTNIKRLIAEGFVEKDKLIDLKGLSEDEREYLKEVLSNDQR